MPLEWPPRLDELRPRLGPPLLVAALFVALPLLLLAPVTIGGRTLVPYDALITDPLFAPLLAEQGVYRPQNELVADLVFQNVVWKSFIVEAVKAGQIPLWNPLIAGGMPFLAAGQHSALYPTTLLFLVLDAERAFGWCALANLALAAIGMYLLGRSLRLGRFASVVMGLAWSLSTLFVANTVFPMVQAAMAWTPILLAAIEWTASSSIARPGEYLPRGRATASLLLVAVATALIGLAGHAEQLYYAGMVAAAYSIFRSVVVSRRYGVLAGFRLALWLALGALAGLLIAGIQLLPLVELAASNWRSSSTYDTVVSYAYGLRQLPTFIVPDLYGSPAHHAVWNIVHGRRTSLAGHTMWGTAWGTKNYVEAAAYTGISSLVLAALGVIVSRRRPVALFMSGLAIVALSFVFGLPTYRLLYYGLPGFEQLHTPFRWVFPFALAIVVLAGFGAESLTQARSARSVRAVGISATAIGAALTASLAVGFAVPHRWVAAMQWAFERAPDALDAALQKFPDVEALASYEFWALLHLALFTTLAGVAVLVIGRSRSGSRTLIVAQGLAVLALALDLLLVGYGFNPANDRALAELRPATVAWLQDTTKWKWGRVVGFGSSNVLWPNTAMRFDIPDLRAYDSIIPRWTVDTLNTIEDQSPPSGMLNYNRIGNLVSTASFSHPALSALGGRYILTTSTLEGAGLRLVYEDDAGKVYENPSAMPRAWLVNEVQVYRERSDLLAGLDNFDPASTVLLEEQPRRTTWRVMEPGRTVYRPSTRVLDDRETLVSKEIEVYAATSGNLLVFSQAWFPGWRAWVETSGDEGVEEVEVPVYRANGAITAVPVPQGLSIVRLKYFPMSIKVGLYTSFLGAILLLIAIGYALWDRYVRVDPDTSVRLVAVNTAGPMLAALLNKLLDFVFAMLYLRILGPEGAGKYYTAIVIIGFADIFTNFGLNLLAAREVSRQRELAPRYVTHTALLRLGLWLLALPALAAYVAFRSALGEPLATDTIMAVALLAAALVPSNLSAALTSIFQAFERMVLPAGVTIASTFMKISFGALVLLAGYGFVGLAGVAIGVNWATLGILAVLGYRAGIRFELGVSRRLMQWMVIASLPLMLNHLLQTVFFKIDVLLLDQILGETVVGWYSAAYKWVDALLVIPAYSIMAIFPLLSRRASDDREGLLRAYTISQRWLLTLALPIALVTTLLAELLVEVLAGGEYLPHGAIALQIMIWFLPLSFVNGLIQYVLIALDRQRWITVSFVIAATFNVAANLLVIPEYGYKGAAVVTILSELILLLPFRWRLRDLDAPPFLVIAWRPALATSITALMALGLDALSAHPLLTATLCVPVYLAALTLLGGVTAEDRSLVRRMLPGQRTG